ncbi:hypothetical protein Halhy_6671 (plasmid) [Haliscomenobacter hydrossis DSM 1100]|uniref:Uncharacterized protein n=1 Tax=Haliscomenobacter hydrossis (strain ATCC 27775 / DSM 1100 / LMG 10767 / O) TaxID=760192 RepID=F4L7X9_HALH1|nr:hypothetical protein Halhy_6671 [Haliscomenobacter hydrossis DSM 1100]
MDPAKLFEKYSASPKKISPPLQTRYPFLPYPRLQNTNCVSPPAPRRCTNFPGISIKYLLDY